MTTTTPLIRYVLHFAMLHGRTHGRGFPSRLALAVASRTSADRYSTPRPPGRPDRPQIAAFPCHALFDSRVAIAAIPNGIATRAHAPARQLHPTSIPAAASRSGVSHGDIGSEFAFETALNATAAAQAKINPVQPATTHWHMKLRVPHHR